MDAEQPLPNLVTERKLGAGEKAALPVATQHSSPPPANRDEVKPERAPLLEKELDVANLRKKSDEVKAERAVLRDHLGGRRLRVDDRAEGGRARALHRT